MAESNLIGRTSKLINPSILFFFLLLLLFFFLNDFAFDKEEDVRIVGCGTAGGL